MKTESTVSTLIGKKIKILRRNAGYPASEFARLSGCKSDQQLYRDVRGVNKIDTNMLVSVLRILNINISSFFEQIADEIIKEFDDYNVNI